jgi:putative molybdopterin biosynthesis protein
VARYRDIAEALLDRVASGALRPGASLASVRATAAELGTTPATVGRAYAELARLGVLDVAPRRSARVARDGPVRARRALGGERRLRLAGSDDPVLDRIAGDTDRIGAPGSFGGLSALWGRRADAATLHLRHRDGRYNDPFIAGVLAGRAPVLVHLWRREQGIMVPAGNPRGIGAITDLAGCQVALRRPGTGTRVLAERLTREAGGAPLAGPEVATHLEAALSVAAGLADAAIGLRAASVLLGLDFVPLGWEPFELALPEDALGLAVDLLDRVASAPALPGIDPTGAGAVRRL